MSVRIHRDLVVWQRAMGFVVEVYDLNKALPSDERFGLVAQPRRAAVSIPSNIAEGEGRDSPGDLKRFLAIAHGSLREVETQIELGVRLGYLNSESAGKLLNECAEIGRTIRGLSRSLRSQDS